MKTVVLDEHLTTPHLMRRLTTQSYLPDFLGNTFAIFIPMLTVVEVNLVGRLFLSEILLVCMLPFLLINRGRLLLAPLPFKLLLFGLCWLMSQILTDIIRGTPFVDWSRGWSKIIFMLLNFSAIFLFLHVREKRFVLFAVGIALGQILIYFFNPNIYSESFPWKFGYGFAVTFIVVLTLHLKIIKRKKYFSSSILLVLGILNLYMDFRSLGLVCLLAGGYIFLRNSNILGLNIIKFRNFILLIVLACSTIYGIYSIYAFGANEGWFGSEVRSKFLLQSSGDFGVILGGRSEILASIEAVKDSPIIGHGSWAKDWKYVDILRAALIQNGYQDPGEYELGMIPSHSYIMGAWVESGLIGAVFWFWVLVLVGRVLIGIQVANLALTPLIIFISFILLWDIPFSPFGATGRLYVAYYLTVMIFALTQSKLPLVKASQV